MNWYLINESREEPVASGTHREMWDAWRKLSASKQLTHYVMSIESGSLSTGIVGGTRDTPKGLRAAGMFPGVKKCIRQSQIRTARQRTRLALRQYVN